jgi:bla regulator protein BlaR1
MIVYLIKGVVCSLVLWAFHFFFLEKERMHRFNRFYLLLAPVLSFCIPFFKLRPAPENVAVEALDSATAEANFVFRVLSTTADTEAAWRASSGVEWLLGIYAVVAAFFLVRFARRMYVMYAWIETGKKIETKDGIMVLMPGPVAICSFMRFVVCSEKAYREGTIPEEIVSHEWAHVRQRHTLDILFIEIVQALYWFNPVLSLFKRSIRLNHEFLADLQVVKKSSNVLSYQHMLVDSLASAHPSTLASTFNYSQTKKRLIMMTQKTNARKITVKCVALALVSGLILYAASDEASAQKAPPPPPVERGSASLPPPPPPEEAPADAGQLPPPPPPPVEIYTPGPGATEEELTTFQNTFKNSRRTEKDSTGTDVTMYRLTEAEKERLAAIFAKMSLDQKKRQTFSVLETPMPKRNSPSAQRFETFKQEGVYGVWLDGRKIENAVLNRYTYKDIAHYWITKLSKVGQKPMAYTHQLHLETNHYFEANLQKWRADRFVVIEKLDFQAKK